MDKTGIHDMFMATVTAKIERIIYPNLFPYHNPILKNIDSIGIFRALGTEVRVNLVEPVIRSL